MSKILRTIFGVGSLYDRKYGLAFIVDLLYILLALFMIYVVAEAKLEEGYGKDFALIAELAHLILADQNLRAEVISRGKARLLAYSEESFEQKLIENLVEPMRLKLAQIRAAGENNSNNPNIGENIQTRSIAVGE